ncbi:hypothetical protein BcDW1_7517 [Botrytis cinerea BcDW1]|uniref:Uncharacterized protein n=1 Tax=Botryotinia fuckeliana (strain BcDW1) TaxID=1290391 RepID=M7TRH3_BOTF1|nr:hypothetical protein BcDW1_7517 [Botrytis cinerea BcDW1]
MTMSQLLGEFQASKLSITTLIHQYHTIPTSSSTSTSISTKENNLKMCTSTSTGLVNRNGPGSAASSTISDIVKGTSTTGKTKCLECDGYECCCIPIPCTVM